METRDMNRVSLIATVFSLAWCNFANADLYKCTDSAGVVIYANAPRPNCIALPLNPPEIQSPDAAQGQIPPTRSGSNPKSSAGANNTQTADDQALERDYLKQARPIAAEIGKDICVARVTGGEAQDALTKLRLSTADVCGCVQRELLVIVPDKHLIDVGKAKQEAQGDSSKFTPIVADEFDKYLRVATNGCLAKLVKGR